MYCRDMAEVQLVHEDLDYFWKQQKLDCSSPAGITKIKTPKLKIENVIKKCKQWCTLSTKTLKTHIG